LNRNGQRSRSSLEQVRADLTARLHARRPEVEQVVLTRVFAFSGAGEGANPDYVAGLRAAVSSALDYGLAVLELGEERSPPVPAALLAQARMAARNRISLDTVLRRYFAGYSLLNDFLIEEVEDGGLFRGAALKHLLRTGATLFDRLLAAVSEEHAREVSTRLDTEERRRAERVQRLLNGELLDSSGFSYDFDAHHLGVIAQGPGAKEAMREFAKSLDSRLLSVPSDEGAVWAWLGSRRKVNMEDLERLVSSQLPRQICLAFGEPSKGLAGWRLTHHQAKAAFSIAPRCSERYVRYVDVTLLASILKDDVLTNSLRELYLAPLSDGRDGGATLRRTLRAYFDADRNVSSAAAALGVNRHTVTSRLQSFEGRIGRSLKACATDVDLALRLESLNDPRTSVPDPAWFG
jgi:DNA-binding PucR family transcriptional regulator